MTPICSQFKFFHFFLSFLNKPLNKAQCVDYLSLPKARLQFAWAQLELRSAELGLILPRFIND